MREDGREKSFNSGGSGADLVEGVLLSRSQERDAISSHRDSPIAFDRRHEPGVERLWVRIDTRHGQ